MKKLFLLICLFFSSIAQADLFSLHLIQDATGIDTTRDFTSVLDLFNKYGRVCVTTEDGSMGEKGFVTNHSVLNEHFDRICTCGPKPMMVAVARYANQNNMECEASLENMMACGLGACLCCVEKTTEGNLCVCKEGPVFNVKRLLWQI